MYVCMYIERERMCARVCTITGLFSVAIAAAVARHRVTQGIAIAGLLSV